MRTYNQSGELSEEGEREHPGLLGGALRRADKATLFIDTSIPQSPQTQQATARAAFLELLTREAHPVVAKMCTRTTPRMRIPRSIPNPQR